MKGKLRLALVGYLLGRSWLPTSWGCLLSQLWLELEALPGCSLQSTGTGVGGWGGGWVAEMQNKAIAQPAWLQLAAGAAAGSCLSLAINCLSCYKYTSIIIRFSDSLLVHFLIILWGTGGYEKRFLKPLAVV